MSKAVIFFTPLRIIAILIVLMSIPVSMITQQLSPGYFVLLGMAVFYLGSPSPERVEPKVIIPAPVIDMEARAVRPRRKRTPRKKTGQGENGRAG